MEKKIDDVVELCEQHYADAMSVAQKEENHLELIHSDVTRLKQMGQLFDHSFEGIIAELTSRCQGNVHDKELVEITASSDNTAYLFKKGPKIVANFHDGSVFCTKSRPESWICYHFMGGMSVIATGYSILSYRDTHRGSPKSWKLEGSNDGITWELIDCRQEDNHLRPESYSLHIYVIDSSRQARYSYLRLQQTGKNHCDSDELVISALEFSGDIFP